jgi:hypothetical protein
MSEEWRKRPQDWPQDVNGYAICPRCGAMIHMRYRLIHADACGHTDGDTDE